MLTTAQQTTLRNAVIADHSFDSLPHNSDGASALAVAFNLPDVSNTQVWNSATPTDSIFNSLTWANYTPNDAADATVTYTNRVLLAQTKQMNLQNILVGRQTVNMVNVQTRAGLRDAVINLPTGTGGANVQVGGASGVNALTACVRPTLATRAEKLLSAGPSTTGTVTADMLVFEGSLGYPDWQAIMGW